MTWDHDRVEELLAGLVLGGLDPEDAALAERAVADHVSECDGCRRALDGFRTVAGDLGLAADPAAPPEVLRVRLLRSVVGGRRRPRAPAWAAAAAAVAAVAGLGGWNALLADRLGEAEVRQRWVVDAITTMGQPEGSVVPLTGPGDERVTMLYVKGQERLYVVASGLHDPEGVYQVWMVRGAETLSAATFVPDHGVAMVPLAVDPEEWELVMVTEEPASGSPTPSASPLVSAVVRPPD